MDNRPIGLFDSGVGGLTVLKELKSILPNENTIYFGDTGRFPYGSKSKEEMVKYSKQIVRFFKSLNVKAIIIACNTISSNCYKTLQEEFNDIYILDIITSGVEGAINCTKTYNIGILATENTVKSGEYENCIKKLETNAKVFCSSCPEFAILAEKGEFDSPYTLEISKKYITPLLEKNIDTLVLGCTHYPLLINPIKKVVGKNICIVNPALNLAIKTKSILEEKNILNKKNTLNLFFVSKNSLNFKSICKFILNKNVDIKIVNIEKY